MPFDLKAYLQERREWVDHAMDKILPRERGPAATVARAMRYAVMGGGKRLRPILVFAACEATGGSAETVIGPAAALEMIHTYSLVHDDLPAMDDDDLRRGRATVHRAFGDAEAVLAGDALLTLAFEVLATSPEGKEHAERRSLALAVVAQAAGVGGMVGGQMADLEAENATVDRSMLEWIHAHKTGALLTASLQTGAIHAGAPTVVRDGLVRYGRALGLAFQIADDILDVTSTAEALGKTPGKDERSGKATYPAIYGLDNSRRMAVEKVEEAVSALDVLDAGSPALESLARYVVERTS